MTIAEEYAAALKEAALDVEGKIYQIAFTRESDDIKPWDTEGSGETGPFTVTAMETEREELIPDEKDEKDPVSMRVFVLDATTGYKPKYGDKITLDGRDHQVDYVESMSPFGSDIRFKIGVID